MAETNWMNFKAQIISVLAVVFCPFFGYSQFSFGGDINIGASKITKEYSEELDDLFDDDRVEYLYAPTGNIGVYANYKFNFNLLLRIEFEINFINGKSETTFTGYSIQNNRVLNSQTNTETKTQLSYFSIPILIGYQLNKLSIYGGLRYSWLINKSMSSKGSFQEFYNGLEVNHISWDNDIDSDIYIKKNDFGALFGIDYAVSNFLILRVEYYHGIENIFDYKKYDEGYSATYDENDVIYKTQQFLIGARFNISELIPSKD